MYKKEIQNYFIKNKENFLKDLSELVEIDSSRGEGSKDSPYGEGPAKALSKALEISEKYGLYTKNMENYIGIASIKEDESRKLDILVHLDVVPAGEGWKKTEPFAMKEIDGKVYGRGVSDNKGPAVAAIYALRAIKELNIPLKDNVRIVFGCDEECGGSDIDYYYSKESTAEMTFTPDAEYPVINIEKGIYYGTFEKKIIYPEESCICRIIGGSKGNVVPDISIAQFAGMEKSILDKQLEKIKLPEGIFVETSEDGNIVIITVRGKSAHASTPEDGINSNTMLLKILSSIQIEDEVIKYIKNLSKMFPHGEINGESAGIFFEDEESGKITVSFNVLEYKDGVMKATFDSRTPICATYEELHKIAESAEINGFEYNDKFSPPHHVSSESEFVKTLINSYEKYSDKKGKAKVIGGGTYVHNIENAVAFGCVMEGEESNMHGADECAVIDTLLMSGMIFTDAIYQICK